MVPTGAPSITAPGGVALPPGPPPDPGPITQAVDSDLTQIAAIDAVARAQQAVLQSRETVAAVQHQLAQAQQGVLHVAALAQRTNLDATVARGQLAQLAIAAYTGEAYPTTGGASSGVGASGTVRTAFGTLGLQAQEADELVRVVADHELAMVRSDRKKVKVADGLVAQAHGVVAHVEAELGAAQQALSGAQQTLVATVHSATTPGAALAAAVSAAGSGSASPGGVTDLVSATTTSPTVLGPSTLSAAEMAGWFASTGRTANASVPITQLAADYIAASQTTGVRGDLAFAQSIIETGYFDFPAGGQLTGSDNNFAGIGACDSCAHGWSFPSALTGVTAQEQLLEAYASTKPVATPLVGPVGIGGCCPTWISLAGHWATDPHYGVSILTIYKQMLDWAIPYRLAEAHLGPAPKVPLPATAPAAPAPAAPATAAARAAP
ncbi:MAG: glucosaminidase domain-containing protein [Acidimicrobiales bacterium]